ncbi:hypothetical protein B0H19DRAFT_12210 [Mycena capillaripes]|nr:hypothetical protein B0H19DRAFT_12210 [Mycena capillaripes]
MSFEKSHLLPISSQTTQLREILRSNIPPSGTVASSLQSFIEESSLELARYDTEIQRLEEALAQLKSDRASMEWYRTGCRSVFSPLHRLPTELLVEIFDLCSPPASDSDVSEDTTPEEEVNRIAKSHLLHLSQVCSRWYSVVMDTPRLWSTIAIDTNAWPESPTSSATLLSLVQSSLKRSAEFPLTMQIAVDPDHPMQQSILELLGQYSHRWKDVYL